MDGHACVHPGESRAHAFHSSSPLHPFLVHQTNSARHTDQVIRPGSVGSWSSRITPSGSRKKTAFPPA
jgi:hypothetical protein